MLPSYDVRDNFVSYDEHRVQSGEPSIRRRHRDDTLLSDVCVGNARKRARPSGASKRAVIENRVQ